MLQAVESSHSLTPFRILGLDGRDGMRPIPDGPVTIRWQKDHGRLAHQMEVPAGYMRHEADSVDWRGYETACPVLSCPPR